MKSNKNMTIDLILLIIYVITCTFLMLELYFVVFFEYHYLLCLGLLLLLVCFLLFRKISNEAKWIWIHRFVILAIDVLMIVLNISIWHVQGEENDDLQLMAIERVYALAYEDRFETLEDMDGLCIGVLSENASLNEQILNKFSNPMLNCEIKQYETYSQLAYALQQQAIQVALVDDLNLSIMRNMYQESMSDIKVVYQFQEPKLIDVDQSDKNMLQEPFTILISGIDEEGSSEINSKSGLNFLVFTDPQDGRIEMLSLNKDTYMPNPNYDNYPDRLSHIGYQGIETMMKSIENTFDIQVDYFLKFSYTSLMKLVDLLQGIQFQIVDDACENKEHCVKVLNQDEVVDLMKNGNAKQRQYLQWQVIQEFVMYLQQDEGRASLEEIMLALADSLTSNIDFSQLKDFAVYSKGMEWDVKMSYLNSGTYEKHPCISWDLDVDLPVYILSNQDLAYVEKVYFDYIFKNKLNQFDFDLRHDGLGTHSLASYVIHGEDANEQVNELFNLLPTLYIEELHLKKDKPVFSLKDSSLRLNEPIRSPDSLQ